MANVLRSTRLFGHSSLARNKDGITEVRPSNCAEEPGVVASPQIHIRTRMTSLQDICFKFLRTTSLHALKFVADSDLSVGEKYFFLAAFLLAVGTSSYYIVAIYYNWMASPIITATSSLPFSIATIPFSAITICNLNQAKKSSLNVFETGSWNYWRLQSLCKGSIGGVPPNILKLRKEGAEYRDFILNVSQPCEEMIISCKFGLDHLPCTSIFQAVLTDEGLCCTFNTVHRNFMFFQGSDEVTRSNWTSMGEPVDWSPEKGYGERLTKTFYPRPALGTGVNMGLSLILNASLDEYYCSSGSSAGFKMMLHSPVETPKIANYGYLISPGMESRVAIDLEVHMAEPSIRYVSKKYRNCLFASESNLKFYRTYSKSNCELECELRRVSTICGCIPYYLPRLTENATICGLKEFNCTRDAQIASDSLVDLDVKCSLCLHPCSSVSYVPVVTASPLIFGNSFLEDRVKVSSESDLNDLAIVHFYYEYNSFRPKTKEELTNFTDFLANSGGILGLFMGFSILAVVEFLYFVFLAPYSAIKKFITGKLVRNFVANKMEPETLNRNEISHRTGNLSYSDRNVVNSFVPSSDHPAYSYCN